MSFLYPLLLAAGLAVAVPAWLHLRARTDAARTFSAVRFLDDQPRPRRRGWRLRDLMLFAARAMAVVLLAGAFAWPYRTERAPRVAESRVYLLDNTMSQRAGQGFLRGRDAVRDALRGAAPEVQVAVIELTSRPRVVAGFGDDREAAVRAVEALVPSFQRGSYLEAFRMADSLLGQSLGARRRIVLHGDGQENQWSENETSPPFLRGIEVELSARKGDAERRNLSLGEPMARRFFLGEKSLVDFSVELSHAAGERAVVVLEANGQRILREAVALQGAPSVVTLRGQWEADARAWLSGTAWIEDAGDALAADDRVFFCLPPVQEGRLAVLVRSPYLSAALAPETTRGRWAPVPLDPSKDVAAVAEEDLADVLVLESDYARSERVRTLAFRYLNNGRGVVLFAGRATPPLGPFLRELGFELAGTATGEDALRSVAADHPVFKPFAAGELGDLTDPRVFRHVRLKGLQAVTLAFGTSGDGLLFEGAATRGRLVVFPFAMEREATDWPLHAPFIPLLDLALQHVRAEAPVQTSSEPGHLLTHDVPSERSVREVVLRAEGREIARGEVDERRRARLRGPEAPGFYTVTYDADTTVEGMVALNPSPRESVLRYVTEPPALKAWSVPSATAAAAAPAPPARTSLSALSQRWWWWLLCAAAAFLALESVQLMLRREAT